MSRGLESQEQRYARVARQFETGVDVNRICGLRVLSWAEHQVVMLLPFDEWLWTTTFGSRHLAAAFLAEICGTGASLAACVNVDSPIVVSTVVNYSAPAHADLIATGVCTDTGPLRHVSKVQVQDADGHIVAEAIVTNAPPTLPSAD